MRAQPLIIAYTLACSACVSSTPPPVEMRELVVSDQTWPLADVEGQELLARLTQLDTSQPGGNERLAAEILREHLLRVGVEASLIPLSGRRASLLAKVRGGAPAGAAPLLLLSHLDTHPATPQAWPEEAGPFSAAIRNDALWGRGVLDGKGLAVVHATVLSTLARAEVALDRPVFMLAVAGGLDPSAPGLQKAIESEPALGNVRIVLTKGGGPWPNLFGDGRIAHVVTTSERGTAQVRLTATMRSDEGQRRDSPAIARLSRALTSVQARVSRPRLTPPTLDTLEHASRGVYFPRNLFMRSNILARTFLLHDLARRDSTAPLVSEELRVVRVGSSRSGGRVAPDRAWAVLEARLLPGRGPGVLKAELRAAIQDPDVHITIESGSAWVGSNPSPELLQAVRRYAWREAPGGQVTVPAMSVEPTGAHPLRALGAQIYGFTPFLMSSEDRRRVETRDERLPLDAFRAGLRALTMIVAQLALDPAADHSTR